MGAIAEMAARNVITEEVAFILWKYGHDLPIREIKECLDKAVSNHVENLNEEVIDNGKMFWKDMER